MELWNSKNKEFELRGIEIIRNQGEILILIRYPYQAGNKDFFLINSEKEYKEFLEKREAKDSITIFKSIENVIEGLVTEEFITQALNNLERPKYSDWVVIFPEDKDKSEHWYYNENKEDLEESLRLNLEKYVRIIEDPDWFNKEVIFHAYVPDEDGKVRPGSY